MERMNAYLRDLLLLHDCVILRDFGGFVGNYKSAQKTEQDYFTPPRKIIAFNPQLKENDGLFANTIVLIEKTDYKTAVQKVENFVAHINKELKAKGEYTIPAVGKLQKSNEERLLFVPDATSNLLATPLGLSSFTMRPLPTQKDESETTPSKAPIIAMPVFRKVLVAGVSGFALLSLLLNQGEFENQSLASLAPIYTESSVAVAPTPIKEEKAVEVIAEETIVVEEKAEIPVQEEVTVPTQPKNYHIVVGCFSMLKNAEIQKDKLAEKGIQATVFDYGKGLTGVCVGSYDSFAEAKPIMEQLRNSGNAPSAWVLKRKIAF